MIDWKHFGVWRHRHVVWWHRYELQLDDWSSKVGGFVALKSKRGKGIGEGRMYVLVLLENFRYTEAG